MDTMKILLALLGTWGVVLGAPVAAYFGLRTVTPQWVAVVIAVVLLLIGVLLGEWLARAMKWILSPRRERPR
jgi:protein-S-isoprenylcysteine O-methyltransferase Ste14